jgi:hypothetical protein
MGAYRLSIYFKWQIGLNIKYENEFIDIYLPFIKIMVSTNNFTNGVKIFNWDSDSLNKQAQA